MGLGGQNIDMVRRRQDAAERWAPRDRDEALSGLGDALGALGTLSFLTAARFTQAGPPTAHRARHSNPYPFDGPREAAAGSGRLELNRLPGFRS